MRHRIYLVLLFGFVGVQAQDKVFNPVEQKAEVCQQYEEIKGILSCEGEDCPPLYTSAVPYHLQVTASMRCAFECVVGERICDETFSPDNKEDYMDANSFKCGRSDNEVPTERTEDEWLDGERVKHILKITTYPSSGCEEYVEYIEVCNEEGQECRNIELYSEEWYEYERQKQLKAYEESCFVATEENCKSIETEMGQCVLGLVEGSSKFFCGGDSSKKALWKYREHGFRVGFFGRVMIKKPLIKVRHRYKKEVMDKGVEAEEDEKTPQE